MEPMSPTSLINLKVVKLTDLNRQNAEEYPIQHISNELENALNNGGVVVLKALHKEECYQSRKVSNLGQLYYKLTLTFPCTEGRWAAPW